MFSHLYAGERREFEIGYWANLETWTIDEAAALAVSISPDSYFRRFNGAHRDVRRMAQRANLPDPVSPEAFLDWANGAGVLPPNELIEAVAHLRSKNVVEEDGNNQNQPETSEAIARATTLQKFVLVVEEYPEWRAKQTKVLKTGNLHDWLESRFDTGREVEVAKKILSEAFPES